MPIFWQQPGPDNLVDVLENKNLRISLGGRSHFPVPEEWKMSIGCDKSWNLIMDFGRPFS
jgi:hypothetical protein